MAAITILRTNGNYQICSRYICIVILQIDSQSAAVEGSTQCGRK